MQEYEQWAKIIDSGPASSKNLKRDLYNVLSVHKISEIKEKRVFDKPAVDFLKNIAQDSGVFEKTFSAAIRRMQLWLREFTSGAAFLEIVLVNKDLYIEIAKDFKVEDAEKIYIGKTEVVSTENVPKELIVGLSRVKFENFNPSNFVITGNIDAKE